MILSVPFFSVSFYSFIHMLTKCLWANIIYKPLRENPKEAMNHVLKDYSTHSFNSMDPNKDGWYFETDTVLVSSKEKSDNLGRYYTGI